MLPTQVLTEPRALGEAIAGGRLCLDEALHAAWSQRAALPGLMRSDLSRMVRAPTADGRFIVQTNPGRASRRAPARSFEHVVAAFDPNAFHFAPGRIRSEEVLLELELDGVGCELLVNVSPFGSCHSLVVIEPAAGLPQVLEERGVRAALALARASARRDLKVGFNSLRACATVNHYHLQCLYFRGAGVEREQMPVELAGDGPRVADGVTRLSGYPIGGWRFQGVNLAARLAGAARVLQDQDVPHNALIAADAAVLIPRVPQDAAGEAEGFAFLELGGELLIVPDASQAGGLQTHPTGAEVHRRIAAAALSEQEFLRVEGAIARILSVPPVA